MKEVGRFSGFKILEDRNMVEEDGYTVRKTPLLDVFFLRRFFVKTETTMRYRPMGQAIVLPRSKTIMVHPSLKDDFILGLDRAKSSKESRSVVISCRRWNSCYRIYLGEQVVFTRKINEELSVDVVSMKEQIALVCGQENWFEAFVFRNDGRGDYVSTGDKFSVDELLETDLETFEFDISCHLDGQKT